MVAPVSAAIEKPLPLTFNLYYIIVQLAHKRVHCSIGLDVQNTFVTPLVAHFDGKLRPDRDEVNADRMSVNCGFWQQCGKTVSHSQISGIWNWYPDGKFCC